MRSVGEQFNQLVETTLKVEQQQEKHQPEQEEQMMIDESAKMQDFSQENRNIDNKYMTARIKSRNFLSNIAYVGISKEDYYNENFVFDVYLLLTKNLNPFSLDRKLADKNKYEMIYMPWRECIPLKFYKHLCKEQNFLYLNGKMCFSRKLSVLLMILLGKTKTIIPY